MKMGSKAKINSKHRVHKGKAKRWKKGHSSTSNPEKNKFREAAKNRFFNKIEGPSSLTVDALVKHDKSHSSTDVESMATESDQQTMGTFKTWATNWTDCTNTTFSKVHRYWSSNSALHKEILAVLAAVTEVIKLQGGKETETEYFAALMTALETTEEDDSTSAIVYLISLVMKRVPVAVLRSKFSEVAKCFLDLMAKYSDGESTSLMKSLLMSLSLLLRSQEAAAWSNSSTQQIYKALLTFVAHKKPKVRKAAHQGVCIVLKGSLFLLELNSPKHHPAASLTAKHCVQVMENAGGLGEAVDTLHTLALLKQILPVLPLNSTKVVCETILKVMTLSNVMVTAGGMQALHSLFAAAPKPDCLSAALNAQVINALYDYQPSENDVQPTQAWLVGVISESLGAQVDIVGSQLASGGSNTPAQKIVRALESGLGYQFHASWGLVLQIFAVLYKTVGKASPKAFHKSLTLMADLRDSVRDDLDFPRSWLLPVIRDNVQETELAFFTSYFLPLAAKLRLRSLELADQQNVVASKTYEALQLQMWSLLPGFCTRPTDLVASFKGIAKVLGTAISERDDLRMEVMASLRKLITQSLSSEQNLQVLDKSLQKKCYRILEEICGGKSEQTRDFVQSHLQTIQQTLLASLSSSSPSSKAPRLRCLAILCTKEVAERARVAAYALLVEMGNASLRWAGEDNSGGLEEFFKMVMAGFAGSPQMISATLMALTRIMYQFKDNISSTMLESILSDVCVLLKSKSREVVQGALGFTKVLVSSHQVTTLAPHLKTIMSSLTSMKEDCHHHFRFKAKEVYTKLVKKFGYETIYGLAPESIRRQLVNVRKTMERAKKQKTQKDKGHDSSDDDEDDKKFARHSESIDDLLKDSDSEPEEEDKAKKSKVKDKGQKVKKAQGGQAWLQEGGDDDITDFMDTSAAKKQQNQLRKNKRRLTLASRQLQMVDSSLQSPVMRKIKQTRKRKLDDLGDSDDEGKAKPKYKAGGGGIHRPLDGQKQVKKPAPGAEYKAKKADGDVKKKGKVDPYAYVPLDFRSLNKRKQAKVKGQFTNFVKGAKKGALKGKKAKKKT
ncbi:RRP12-like protein [Mya arenaria]|uniref:RRP12-like protein n=1 Tax=Mya arenaria TaxID=6604 RepID=A0ABY7FL97_MYAAR|nr:RRP12-like protein [Mya arenaria]